MEHPQDPDGIELDPDLASRAEVEAALGSGQALLVDVMELEHFQAQHIPGAISLPLAELESKASKLLPDREKPVIVYCAGYT